MSDWILSLFGWRSTPTYEPMFAYGGCSTELSWLYLECWLD